MSVPVTRAVGRREKLEAGEVTIDENYRESILDHQRQVVLGFPKGVMPTFAGQCLRANYG